MALFNGACFRLKEALCGLEWDGWCKPKMPQQPDRRVIILWWTASMAYRTLSSQAGCPR